MRTRASPEDIDRVLTALGKAWLQSPSLRLGQLLINLLHYVENCREDNEIAVLWNLDEDQLLTLLDNWVRRAEDSNAEIKVLKL